MDRVSVHLMEWLSIHLELYVCPLFRILLPSKGCWRTAARAAAVSPEPRPGMHLRRSPLDSALGRYDQYDESERREADARAISRARSLPSELPLMRSLPASMRTPTLLRLPSARAVGSKRVVSISEQELTEVKPTDTALENLLHSQVLRSDRC